jgi:hypothetical protein
MNDLINRLRCHEQHAVHDYDDDCEEAANEIERLTAEVTRLRRNVQNLLDIIDDHKVCTDDVEDSCIRIADYEKDGKAWPPDYLRAASGRE